MGFSLCLAPGTGRESTEKEKGLLVIRPAGTKRCSRKG